jgi:dienelactone hydrolase
MCHFDAPAGSSPAPVVREEVQIPLPEGQQLPAFLVRPERGDGAPVLVVEDIFGRSPFYEDVAVRLAAAGYTALLPDFFFRHEPLPERNLELAYARCSRLDQKHALRELHVAIDWLLARTGRAGQRVGTIGFCLGGTFVLDLAAERDDLATVCYYGFPGGDREETELTAPIPLAVVNRMHGPILGLWGDQDIAVGMDNVARLAEALRSRGVPNDQVIYPGVGHAFLAASPDNPAPYQAAQDSWARTLAFYRTHLGAPAGATP